jgi:hypothetical protein
MASVLGVGAIITVAVVGARGGRRALPLALAVLLLGAGVGFAPLLARNLAVGAPPLSVSCRTQINFVHANEADAPRGGADFSAGGPSEHFVEILEAAEGSFPRAIAGVWRSYDGDLGRLAHNAWLRFSVIWHRDEIPDNTSYYFFRRRSAVLAWLPGFALVFPLAAVGLAASLARLRADKRALASHAVLVLVLIGLVSSLTLIHTVARFRLYLVPLLWVYAGLGFAALQGAVAGGERRKFATFFVVMLSAIALQAALSSGPPDTRARRSDYSFASRLSLADGELSYARELAEEAARLYPGKGSYFANLALSHAARGEHAQASADFERAARLEPTLPNLAESIEEHRRQIDR